jgi:hypothetical protein
MAGKLAIMQAYQDYQVTNVAAATIQNVLTQTQPKNFVRNAIRRLNSDQLKTLLESLKSHREESRIEPFQDIVFADILATLSAHESAIEAIKEALMASATFVFAREYLGEKFDWKSYEKHILKGIEEASRRRGREEGIQEGRARGFLDLGDRPAMAVDGEGESSDSA